MLACSGALDIKLSLRLNSQRKCATNQVHERTDSAVVFKHQVTGEIGWSVRAANLHAAFGILLLEAQIGHINSVQKYGKWWLRCAAFFTCWLNAAIPTDVVGICRSACLATAVLRQTALVLARPYREASFQTFGLRLYMNAGAEQRFSTPTHPIRNHGFSRIAS